MQSSSYPHVAKLSNRELEVLRLIANEKTTSEIGNILYITQDTIKTHRKNIMLKLGAINVAGMVRRAYEAGVLVL